MIQLSPKEHFPSQYLRTCESRGRRCFPSKRRYAANIVSFSCLSAGRSFSARTPRSPVLLYAGLLPISKKPPAPGRQIEQRLAGSPFLSILGFVGF